MSSNLTKKRRKNNAAGKEFNWFLINTFKYSRNTPAMKLAVATLLEVNNDTK